MTDDMNRVQKRPPTVAEGQPLPIAQLAVDDSSDSDGAQADVSNRKNAHGTSRQPPGQIIDVDHKSIDPARLHAIMRTHVFKRAKARLRPDAKSTALSRLLEDGSLARFKQALYQTSDRLSGNRTASIPQAGMEEPGKWLSGQPLSTAEKLAFLEATARALGDDWSRDARSFLHVTIAMGHLQLVLRQVMQAHAQHHARGAIGTALITVPPQEEHSFAQCLVEELFRADGWSTDLYCPADTAALITRINRLKPHIVCLSWSTSALRDTAMQTIKAIDSIPYQIRPAIISGGRASHDNNAWMVKLGVDCVCDSTYSALAAARHMLELRTSTGGTHAPSSFRPASAALT